MSLLINETVRIFSLCRVRLWNILEEKRSTHPEFINFAHAQLYFIGDRSQSLIILIQNDRLWDAEIIMRSIMEATIRILFVCYASENERIERINEFWNDLAEINELKRSEKAKMLLQRLGLTPSNEIGIKPLILSEEEEKTIRNKWPKKLRQALEQKWSFSEIIFFLESNMNKNKGGSIIRSTLHNYGLSSHLIHADETGLSLLWDRNHRPSEEREKLVAAHICRLLSDNLSHLFLVWYALLQVFELDKTELNSIYEETNHLFQEFDIKREDFWETQKT